MLDSPDEVHALVHGYYRGFFGRPGRPDRDDARDELPYFRLGYLLGYMTRLAVIAELVRQLAPRDR